MAELLASQERDGDRGQRDHAAGLCRGTFWYSSVGGLWASPPRRKHVRRACGFTFEHQREKRVFSGRCSANRQGGGVNKTRSLESDARIVRFLIEFGFAQD